MINVFPLTTGDHQLGDLVEDWGAAIVPGSKPPLVELLASIECDPKLRGRPSRGSTPTTLAIQMDPRVAMRLYEQIRNLAHSMGWALP